MPKKMIILASVILLFSIPSVAEKAYTVHLKSGKTLDIKDYTRKGDWYTFQLLAEGQMHLHKNAVEKIEEVEVVMTNLGPITQPKKSAASQGKQAAPKKSAGDIVISRPASVLPTGEGGAAAAPKTISRPSETKEKKRTKGTKKRSTEEERVNRNKPPSVR